VSSDIFADFARDVFGAIPQRAAIASAFRRRAMEVHPDLQLAYDHPVLQQAAEDALSTHPEIRELVWARDVLMKTAPSDVAPSDVTGKTGYIHVPILPVTPKKPRTCAKCQRELAEREYFGVGWGPHRSRRRGWCYPCVRADDSARAADRRRRRRANRRCVVCATIFTPSRSDGLYCSRRCRQKAYRGRVTTTRRSVEEPIVNVTLLEAQTYEPEAPST
jgi:hypothetical protein